MADIIDGDRLKKDILSDMRVELTDEFDQNFTRKAFFTKKWQKRKDPNALGSLLHVTGTLRRSIKSSVTTKGVRFTSQVPYATIHNEGGKGTLTVRSHTRTNHKTGRTYAVRSYSRRFNMPQRQFIGDGKETQKLIRNVIEDNLNKYHVSLTKFIRKK